MVLIDALASANVGEIKNGEGEARRAADVDFVGGEPCSGIDGVVVCALLVWELHVLVVFLFVDHHGKHQDHRMMKALNAALRPLVQGW